MRDRSGKQRRVGFVGLGDIGEPMARCMLAAGFQVMLWARREASLAPFAGTSCRRAASLTELGQESDVVGVCVFDEQDVTEVVLGDDGILTGMTPGGVILVHSTVPAGYAVDLARRCAAHGVTVLDAPVSGFRPRAVAGRLTVMVGGPVETFQQVRPILESFGEHVEHLGTIGQGLRTKGLNQALLFANIASAALALETGRRLGLDREATERVLRSGGGGSAGMEVLAGRVLKDPAFARLVGSIAEKDLAVFDDLCGSAGVSSEELRGMTARAGEAMARLLAES